MINILINGINGKMGNMVLSQAKKNDEFNVVAGIDVKKDLTGNIPIYENPCDVKEKIDCIIDFSIPRATIKILDFAVKKKIPLVIATTGHTDEQLNFIAGCSKFIPIFKSANMSFTINMLIDLINKLGKTLYNDYDIEILEKHHNRKVDAPSGTAYLIANSLKEYIGDRQIIINPHRVGKREKKEIGITALRGGNVVGEHSVFFFGENETIEIKHTCDNRAIFADGALKAAKYILDKPNGLYSMKDLI